MSLLADSEWFRCPHTLTDTFSHDTALLTVTNSKIDTESARLCIQVYLKEHIAKQHRRTNAMSLPMRQSPKYICELRRSR